MRTIRAVVVMTCMAGLCTPGFGQSAPSAPPAPPAQAAKSAGPPRITTAEAKNHIGDTVTVCGKVVDNQKVPKYGIAGHGKPVSLDLDQPEPNPIFFFP